jgi:hypothetical protein
MKTLKNKIMALTISIFLMLSMTTSTMLMQTTDAHSPSVNIPTWAYINTAPNPIGVGQQLTIVFWRNQVPPTAAGDGGDRWRNIMIYITKPDGSKETLGPFTSDPVGGTYALYTPTEVGTYNFSVTFPEQVLSLYGPSGLPGQGLSATQLAAVNDTYLACSSSEILNVTQTQVAPAATGPQFPTDYWSTPIFGENTNWYTIASNWLNAPEIMFRVQPYGIAPNTAHIMWTQPYDFGGVVGGSNADNPDITYYDGLTYEAPFQTPLIINGYLYYEGPLSDQVRGGGYYRINLETGQQVWYQQNLTGITFGQLFDYESLNQHGVIPNGYLWKSVTDSNNGGTVWMAYDPLTGGWLFNETNVPSGTSVYGPRGEILVYQLNYAGRWLACWNNTADQTGLQGALGTSSSAYQWRPVGKNVNMSAAYSWNITIPNLNGLSNPSIVRVLYGDLLLGTSSTFVTNAAYGGTQNPYTMWAISLKPQSLGQLMWIQNYTAPANNITRTIFSDPGWPQVDQKAGVFIMRDIETMQDWGYSLVNGSLLWGPTVAEQSSFGFYYSTGGPLSCKVTANGYFYSAGYGGILYCYDLKTGNLVFTYGNGGAGNSTYAGFATPYGEFPLGILAVADGKVYMGSSEHSPNAPYWNGALIRCIDAYNGTEYWTLPGYAEMGVNGGSAEADGFLVFLNLYDNQLYCVGKGPSATTVEAPMTAITSGTNVTIQGRVTDIAAGTKQSTVAADFPNGVAAVSDDSQNTWMPYVYEQQPKPKSATGVEVTLSAIDPNGNFISIGTTTSDTSSLFGYSWKTPDVPGKYTIIANFDGSKSYWPSYSETTLVVQAAAATSEPTSIPTSVADLYFVPAIAALFILIIAVAIILALLMLRKKP